MAAASSIGFASPDASAQIIVAHRGASDDGPENTIAAFKTAWEQQADGVEADFHLTSDGQIVCIHDSDTERVSGTKRVVATTSLASLRELEVGRWKGAQWQGEPIPTFAEVLKVIPPAKWFFIELKTGPAIVPPLAQQMENCPGDRDRVVIISFNAATIARCKELLPDIKAHWLTGFKRVEETGSWQPDVQEIADTVRASGADGVGIQGRREVVVPRFVQQMREAGISEFHVWTIDDPEDAKFFQSQGTIGITTNRPELIRRSLEDRP